MNKFTSKVAAGLFSILAIFSAHSYASVISEISSLGMKKSPGQIEWSFNAISGLAQLDFELAGYRSLDGYGNGNCCNDIFHLVVNGTEVFTGSFNMGGGGKNTVLFNPNGGTALTTTFGATDDIHNSKQTTWQGGLTKVSLPINLLMGSNQLEFSYTGYGQAPNDEWWGLNVATVTRAIQVNESSSYILLVIGFLGILTLRRKSA